MKRVWKRTCSLLLAIVMAFSLLPVSAWAAASAPTEGSEQYQYAQGILNQLNAAIEADKQYRMSPAIPVGGNSDLYRYDLTRNHYEGTVLVNDVIVIVVPGTGGSNYSIPDYTADEDSLLSRPWGQSSPSAVYIASGVTGIGDNAFYNMNSLQTVEFQNASELTYIGEQAFSGNSRVKFTDQGHTEDINTLDLSNVTTMGQGAFRSCAGLTGVVLGETITAKEAGQLIPNKLPNSAFASTGLTSIDLPTGITAIGDSAFSGCSLRDQDELVLPKGLTDIGASAFALGMGTGDTTAGITTLTIPSTVTTIGASAFSGRRNLREVTVEDDGIENTQITIGDHAFGYDENTAYSYEGTITDAKNPEIQYTGLMGTTFLVPLDILDALENHDNCYTGDITPMEYQYTQDPDCITPGFDEYKTTVRGASSGGKDLEILYHHPIPALGHDYGEIKEIPVSCETENYFVQFCQRKKCPNKGQAVGALRQDTTGPGLFDPDTDEPLSEEQLNEWRAKFKTPQGHQWKACSVENPAMDTDTSATLYYVCTNPAHDNDMDQLDSPVTIPLTGKTITALTTQSLNDIADQLTGFSQYGTVSWAEPSDEEFGTEQTVDVPVKYTITTGTGQNWPVFTEAPVGTPDSHTEDPQELTVQVKVEKDILDLHDVSILPGAVNVGDTASVQISGFQEATGTQPPEYNVNGAWTTTQPTTEGTYQIRVCFTYNNEMYDLPQVGDAEYPSNSSYTLKTENGKTWVERDFTVSLHQINAEAEAIGNLVYDDGETGMLTIRISSLEVGQKVTATVINAPDGVSVSNWKYTAADTDTVTGLPMTQAGDYTVRVTFTYPGHLEYQDKTQTLQVHIDHKQVAKPTPTPNLTYLPTTTGQDGFAGQSSTVWKFVDDDTYTHTGNSAGSYTAKARLTNNNYRWANTAETVREIEIDWSIQPRSIVAPSIPQGASVYTYAYGTWRNPLSMNNESDYEFQVDQTTHTVTLVYVGNKGDANYDANAAVAYVARDAYHTNRDEYTIDVALSSTNYQWSAGEPSELTWSINPATLSLPDITAQPAEYTGTAYDTTKIHVDAASLPGDVSNNGYQYSRSTTFSGATTEAPKDCGTYYVRVNYKYDSNNYNATIPSTSFSITQKTVTLTGKTTPVDYDGNNHSIEDPDVTGIVAVDEANWGNFTYAVKQDDGSYGAASTVKPVFKEAGNYTVQVGISSTNYKATPVECTLIIQGAQQDVVLTPVSPNQWDNGTTNTITAKLTDGTIQVTGQGMLNGQATAETPDYSIAAENEQYATVDDQGVVTLKRVTPDDGITVTVSVPGHAGGNYLAVSGSYTLKIVKGDLSIEAENQDYTYGYAPEDLEAYKTDVDAKLTGAPAKAVQPTGGLVYQFYNTLENAQNGSTDGQIAAPTGAGTFYLRISYPGDDNYNAAAKVITVTIRPRTLTAPADGYTGTYDGAAHAPVKSITVTGVNGALDSGDYTVTYQKKTDDTKPDANDPNWNSLTVQDVAHSGEYWYKVTVGGADASNYEPYIGFVNVSITAREITLTPDVTKEKIYDGTNTAVINKINGTAYSDSGITVDGAASEQFTVTASATYDNKNVEDGKTITVEYTVTSTNADLANYTFNGKEAENGKVTDTVSGKITPKPITVTGVDAVDRVYNGSERVQLTGTPETTGMVDGDELTLTLKQGATGTVGDKKASDSPKTVTVDTGVITRGGTDAGNYQVTAVVTDTASNKIDVTISKATVALSVKNAVNGTVTEGYTGQPIVLTAEITGSAFDETLQQSDVEFTFKQNGSEAQPITVGRYDVTVALKSGAEASYANFDIQSSNCTLEITNAALTVGAQNYSGSYTGQSHDLTNGWTFVSSTGNAVSAPTVSFALKGSESQNPGETGHWISGDEIKNVSQSGSYWYKVEYESHTDYYSANTVEIEIAPAQLTLSSKLDESKGYDGNDDASVADPQLSGQQNIENITVTAVSAAYNSKDVGIGKTITVTYTVNFGSGVDADNYTADGQISQNGQTWTVAVTTNTGVITAKPVTVTILDQPKVYDGTAPSVTSNKDTDWTVSDDDAIIGSDDLGVTLSVTGSQNVGTYNIIGKWSNQNYAVTFAGQSGGTTGKYTITARPVAVTIGDKSGIYGDTPNVSAGAGNVALTSTSTAAEEGIVQGESIYTVLTGLQLTTTATNTSPITDATHSYTISATNGVYGNYNVTFTPGTYTVNKRPVTVTIADKSSLYGQGTVDLTSSTSNMANGESLDVELGTDATQSSNVGTYAIYVVAMDQTVAANYDVTVVGQTEFDGNADRATYTINKAQVSLAVAEETLQVGFGDSKQITVTFTNESSNSQITDEDDLAGLMDALCFSSNDSSGYEIQVVNGTVTVTAKSSTVLQNIRVTLETVRNFQSDPTGDSFVLIGVQGQLDVQVFPVHNLHYTGAPQELVYASGTDNLPDGVTVQYTLNSGDDSSWSETIPTQTDADTYTVYWRINDPSGAYAGSGVTREVRAVIAKASLQASFEKSEDSVLLSAGTYELADNHLTLKPDTGYDASKITFSSSNPAVAEVSGSGLTLKGIGFTMITATLPEDANRTGTTATFLLYVNNENSMTATAADVTGTYDGVTEYQISVQVSNAPTGQMAQVGYYWVAGDSSLRPSADQYTAVNPAFREAGTYTVFYYVTAAGANPVSGKALVTIQPKAITGIYDGTYDRINMVSKLSASEFVYSGNEVRPVVQVWDTIGGTDMQLTPGVDYEVVYRDNVNIGSNATVTVRGLGNYGGEVEQHFSIVQVSVASLTAELDRYYGTLDVPTTTSATVSVRHGDHAIDSQYIQINGVIGPDGTGDGCSVSGLDLTFSKPGVYVITVSVVGDPQHAGTMTVRYMLMPKTSSGGFGMTFGGQNTVVVTYGERLIPQGETITDLIKVTNSEGDPLQYGVDYDLQCAYYDYLGTKNGEPITAVEEIPAAGMYVVTATGKGSYDSSQNGSFTLLVLQKSIGSSDIAWTVADDALEYNAGAQEPTVTSGTFTDEAGGTQSVDFAVDSYQNNTNAGSDTARAIVKAPAGSNNYTGTASVPFSIGRRTITDDAAFNITVPATVNISTGGAARPEVTIYDNDLDRALTSQDYTVTYANNDSAGTATATITGTGNYQGTVERTFTVVVTSTRFEMEITPAVWEYQSTGKPTAITVTNDGAPLAIGTDYVLSISKDSDAAQQFTDTASALNFLDRPGTYEVTAHGTGSYSFTESKTVIIEKAKLTLSITVTPSAQAGSGTAKIQVTPGTWPGGMDATKLTQLTVTKDGTVQTPLTLEYDQVAGAYKEVSFSFPNETAAYTFGVDMSQIPGFDADCYETAVTGGILNVVEQTGGGGGGGGGGTVTPPVEEPDDGIADPDDTGVSSWLITGEHIQYLSGYGEGLFGPTDNMTRTQAAQMFYNLLKNKEVSVTVSFTDVPADAWYAEPVGVLASLGILNGVGEGLYEPDRAITRAEFTAIAMRFAHMDTSGADIFPDVHANDWFYEVVVSAVNYGWINGYADGTFRPDETITRAEVAAIVNRMLGRSADKAYVDTHADELTQFTDVSPYYWAYYDIMEAANAHNHTNQGGVETWQN
ncbi:S-layer homology domain-containing protein [Intestinimonas butyriciproducens]|uniref:S-layer homology domain-containing protein n=1 Tax=Intestinimonas butyriciproducens TaxID=1297617 RepID=UPI0019578844|nr:YDG domain-containing protein [Intestinimonas butyriciproducens]MBM6919302.1 S-layer homology domain-containing protein [Intestinimonas butyriciproducens]